MKILKGDTVVIIAGKDKGKSGSVLRVLQEKNRIVVAGINMRTKFTKKTVQNAGSMVRFEGSIHASNVMIVDPKTGKPTRIGYKIDEKGKKTRIARASGTEIKQTATAKPKKVASGKGPADSTDAKKGAGKKDASNAQRATSNAQTAEGAKPANAPFWKKLGFGSGDSPHGDDPTLKSTPGADASARSPDQTHTRSASRGS